VPSVRSRSRWGRRSGRLQPQRDGEAVTRCLGVTRGG
jgi:hypothetical protein